ncbi:MAG: hypothetical protein IJW31_00045 [Lentisphaeria bacterium]|nr:hypothetical protein [Lentisphaeria bacterium]
MTLKIKKSCNSGQVLITGLIMVLILLLAIFIFFDVHNVIRAKIKVETAEQAAALAGARWQGESLNLVGEMNLLIANEMILASSVVVTPENVSDIREKAEARVKAINELQTRVCFLGPLIGFSAAQQAGKNNGMNPIIMYGGDVGEYLRTIDTNVSEEDSKYPDKVNGFFWKEPYMATLNTIAASGVAVRPSGNANGIENITPRFLADETLYRAVISASAGRTVWCHYWLRQLVKKPDDFFIGKSWYMPDFRDIRHYFIKQSEIYSIYANLDNTVVSDETYDEFLRLLQRPGIYVLAPSTDSSVLNRSVCRFFVYDDRYFPEYPFYNGPDIGPWSMWRQGLWLRKDLQDNFLFGGAVAYAESMVGMGRTAEFKAAENPENKIANVVEQRGKWTNLIGGGFGSVAKAFSSSCNPIDVPIVAPVFDQVTLIPGTMHGVRPFTMQIPLVEEFIKYLAYYDVDIHNPHPEPPNGTDYMLEALQLLADPDFRKRGYNTDFRGLDNIPLAMLFTDEYKYPNRVDGAGWLQQPCLRETANPPPGAQGDGLYLFTKEIAEKLNEELRKKYELSLMNKKPIELVQYPVPESDEKWVFKETQYLVIKNGKIFDNENDPVKGCGAFTGHNGLYYPGVNTGPSYL